MDFIKNITFSTNDLRYPLEDNPTAEELAVQWLIQDDPLELSAATDQFRLTQRYALLTLWFGTNGPSWTSNSSWLEDENECTWQGIACGDSESQPAAVVSIDLTSNGLDGTISVDGALLPNMNQLS